VERTRFRVPFHVLGIAPAVLLATWLTRHWFLSGALPAGTDMLGFVSRAAQNRGLHQAISLWDPAGWGARRTLTIESLLGVVSSITGDAVLTVKLFALAVLVTSGVTAYALAWRIGQSRLGAATAGLLYLASQQSLSHWASGQLNVEVGIALTPLIVLLWMDNVRSFSVARACALGATAAFVVFARPDLVLYPLPFLALYVVIRLALGPDAGATLRSAALTAGFTLMSTIALSAYLVVPAVAGIRARWLTGSDLFGVQQLIDRSLGAYQSLLGFAREIGYLAFTGQETWTSHPWFPFSVYAACASVCVVLAYAGPAILREERTIFLGATAVLATFMAKGVRSPLGDPFLWLVRHVPVFGNLRDPNRWLIPQTVAYAVLGGITLAWLAKRLPSRATGAAAAAAVVTIALLPVAPTLLTGFRTVSVSNEQKQLLSAIGSDHQQALVASVPYDQTYRFVKQADYSGWEHDLGSESVAVTGHPTVGDGGWDQQSADTVAYTATLLHRGDPAVAGLLGTLGVKYLLDFSYPATAPNLLADGGPFAQQRAVARLSGLHSLISNRAGTLFTLPSFTPALSFRPRIALVFGGRDGIAAFADASQVHLRSWAIYTADDVLAHSGIAGLLDLAKRADELVVANTDSNDLAVLASPEIAGLDGITSDPGLAAKTQIITSDASTRTGSLASETTPPAATGVHRVTTTFRVAQTERLELWARVRSNPSAARLTFDLDGRAVGSLTPVTVVGGGFRWYRIAIPTLSPGVHRLTARASASVFGRNYELDQARLISPLSRRELSRAFARLLHRHRNRILYSYTPAEIERPLRTAALGRGSVDVTPGTPRNFWRIIEPARVQTTAMRDGVLLALNPTRRYHTFVEHAFGRGLDWSGIDHLFLRFRGVGSGAIYRLLVDFNHAHRNSASLLFRDVHSGWSTLVFGGVGIGSAKPEDWSHVVSIRLATDDRSTSALVGLGKLRVSLGAKQTLRFPLVPVAMKRHATFGNGRQAIKRGAHALALQLSPRLLASDERVIVAPVTRSDGPAPPQVAFTRTGPASYRFRFRSRTPGVLMLDQSYDPRWQLKTAGRTLEPISTFGLVNGYLLPAGDYTGSIAFNGENVGELGAGVSGLSLLLLIGVALWTTRTGRRARGLL
jgi:hypothetical protein